MDIAPYIIERVPSKYMRDAPQNVEIWYCHKKGYDYIPVMGSIGTKKQAADVCKAMNLDGKVHYER